MIETLLAMDPVLVSTFIVAGFLLNITPGVDFLYVTASAINGGPRIGRAAALGVNIGIIVHVAAASMGVSAIIIAYPAAYKVIQYLGAAYLMFIAIRAWGDSGDIKTAKGALTRLGALKRGFLTNVLNPKTALFIFAFIPQFTDPSIGPIWHQILILGAIFSLNGFAFILVLATAAGHMAPLLRKYVGLLNKITAILFGGLAAKLVLE